MMRTLFRKNIGGVSSDIVYEIIAGNSSDTKPTYNISTGSSFREVDTGDKYIYNENSGEWTKSSIAE